MTDAISPEAAMRADGIATQTITPRRREISRAASVPLPKIWTAAQLASKQFEPLRFVVDDLLPAGYAVLAGGPKLGKSWICYQAAVAIATGGDLWGRSTHRGDVLYLALEDGERRAQGRLLKVLGDVAPPDNFAIATDWPKINAGGLEQIEAWAAQACAPRACFIDTFQKVRPPSERGRNAYEGDYELHGKMHALAHRLGILILSVTHFRKGSSGGDFVEAVSGSTGITGAADTILALQRDRGKADGVLHITGRDLGETELALHLEGALWRCLGNAADVRMHQTRQKILSALRQAGRPLSYRQVAEAVDLKRDTAKKALQRMCEAGQVNSTEHGYVVSGA